MQPRFCLTIAATLSFLVGSPSHSRAAAGDGSPEEVVRKATDSLNQGREEEFARAMHPAELRRLREALSTIVDEAARDGKADQVLRIFPGVKSVEQLKELDDMAFFTAYLRAITGHDPAVKKALAKTKVEVLGHVAEGKDTTHVVYRSIMKGKGDDDAFFRIMVVSLRKDGPRWAMLLSGDAEATMAAMKQRFAANPAVPDLRATKIQLIGQLLEGKDRAYVVYRTITPLGDTPLKKVSVMTIDKEEPGWAVVRSGDSDAIARLIKERTGL